VIVIELGCVAPFASIVNGLRPPPHRRPPQTKTSPTPRAIDRHIHAPVLSEHLLCVCFLDGSVFVIIWCVGCDLLVLVFRASVTWSPMRDVGSLPARNDSFPATLLFGVCFFETGAGGSVSRIVRNRFCHLVSTVFVFFVTPTSRSNARSVGTVVHGSSPLPATRTCPLTQSPHPAQTPLQPTTRSPSPSMPSHAPANE